MYLTKTTRRDNDLTLWLKAFILILIRLIQFLSPKKIIDFSMRLTAQAA